MVNHQQQTILEKKIYEEDVRKNIVLSTIDMAMDGGTSHEVEQDLKVHGCGSVNRVQTSITTYVVENQELHKCNAR